MTISSSSISGETISGVPSAFITPVLATTTSLNPNSGSQGQTLNVTATGIFFDSRTVFSFGSGITVSSTIIVSVTQATLTLIISPGTATGLRNLTTTTTGFGSTVLANAFNVFQGATLGVGDFFDYIFRFQDQGSFLRDPTIQLFAPQVSNNQPGVQLLVYNPVETLQKPIPSAGNVLVFPPQLAQSTVPLSGFWTMLTIQSSAPIAQFITHPNLQILNDRTLMFKQLPSVIQARIDVSHINIVINIFGVYVTDGLKVIISLLLEDESDLLLEDGKTPIQLETQ